MRRLWHRLRARARNHRGSIAEAQQHLKRIQQQQPEVDALAAELERRRRTDRFSEQVRAAFGGRG